MAAILVTGASGLIGSHIVLALLAQGQKVRALTRDVQKSISLFHKLIGHYQISTSVTDSIDWFEGDLRNISIYDSLLEDIDGIFHCAGLISTSPQDRKEMIDLNVRCTADLVNYCLNLKIKWFGYISSVATLGPNPEGLVDEDYFWKQDKKQSAYSVSKYLAEQEVWRAKEEGLPVFIFNPSVVIGPGASTSNFAKLLQRMKRGLPFYLKGSTGFVDVRDLAMFCILQWQKNEQGKRVIVSAKNYSQHEVLLLISRISSYKTPPYPINNFFFKLFSLIEFILKFGNSR
jgi:dihydroflavonol-4-reductase